MHLNVVTEPTDQLNNQKICKVVPEAYHGAKVKPDSGKIEWHHSEKVKELPKSINIPAENLFPISTSYLSLEQSDLI